MCSTLPIGGGCRTAFVLETLMARQPSRPTHSGSARFDTRKTPYPPQGYRRHSGGAHAPERFFSTENPLVQTRWAERSFQLPDGTVLLAVRLRDQSLEVLARPAGSPARWVPARWAMTPDQAARWARTGFR